jgi:penicillin-binding protein 1C
MAIAGFATPRDIARAADEPLLTQRSDPSFLAPHFTTRVLQRFGETDARDGVLRTTLDIELQTAIESEVRHTVQTLDDRAASQAAAVVLDNRTGGVLAWVGSPDFFAEVSGQVDMVVSARQPGSALKPFLYALAFDRGYSPATVLPDVPHTFATSTGPYRPQNYDRRFRGPVRVREALASSYNVPAVDMAERVGAGALLGTLRSAGFKSLGRTADHYGLGHALGNGEVTLVELANAYGGLANGGVWRPERRLVADGAGRTVEWAELSASSERRAGEADALENGGERFASAGAAARVVDILDDPVARVPGFGVETPLDFPFPAAAKTGTSRHFTDNWAVATTAGFTVAVWVGNFSGRPMQGVSGITGAGPLLYRAVLQTAKRYAPGALPTPAMAGAIAEPVCVLSGLRATPSCPSIVERFLPGPQPLIEDDWPRSGRVTRPAEYAEWQAQAASNASPALAATRIDPADTNAAPREDAQRRILSPQNGDVYEKPPGIEAKYATLPLVATAGPGDPVRWTVDGRPVDGARWTLAPGRHVVRATWRSGGADSVRVVVR